MKKVLGVYKVVLVLFIFTVSFSCDVSDNNNSIDEVVDISHFNVSNFPRVDGSTSNIPMMTVICCELFDLEYKWYDAGDGTMIPFPMIDSAKTEEVNFVRNILFSKSIRAFNRLIFDSTDVILVANAPSPDQLQTASSQGVSFTIAPIALDGLVFLFNSANPLNNLTSDQVTGIYSGEIVNWNEVGGVDAKINPYIRNPNSGSQVLMEELVMKGRIMITDEQMILSSMMGLINKIVEDPYGIGYSVYFYSSTMVPRNEIKRISIDNIKPDPATINSGAYKFTAPVYAVIRSDLDKNSNAYLFWKWLKTAAGQTTIAKSGYVSYSGKN